MFISNDIYTVNSTALKLMKCWTDKVTKFDSNSFYNWEQDNMPVYDLEERTHYLWEKMGFPTSSIPGLSLVVSSAASDQAVACNTNIFRSVSAAVNALPEVINFPVLIEVANFGQLGDMVLNNIKFGPRGSLEIINRNFSRPQAFASGTIASILPLNIRLNSFVKDSTNNNLYSYASALSLNSDANAIPLLTLFDTSSCFKDASCLTISASVFSSVSDNRLSNNCNGFVSIPNTTRISDSLFKNSLLNKGSLIVASKNSSFSQASIGLTFKTYDLNAETAEAIATRDVSTIDLARDGVTHLYLNDVENTYAANGLFYGNILNRLVINNCEGPIFIRNFFLDGSGVNSTTNLIGVEINNCTNVFLENNVAVRYRRAGFRINNSNVTLLRGCVASRNYDFDAGNNRVVGAWSTKRLFDTFNSTYDYTTASESAGLIANNSFITVSSTRLFEDPLYKARVLAKFPGTVTDWVSYTNVNYIFDFSKNANGIILNNSTLRGGDNHNADSADHLLYAINLNIYGNTDSGIKALNSTISFNGGINVYENLFGIKLDSSVFEIDKLTLIFNQKTGLECYNSNINYNKNLIPYASITEIESIYAGETYPTMMFSGNGQHIVLNASRLLPIITSGMDVIYQEIKFQNSIGVEDALMQDTNIKQIVPGIELTNGSQAVLVSPLMTRDANHALATATNATCRGSELAVLNNSKATLKGTRSGATRVFGPPGRQFHKTTAGVYAGNNSTVELNGPTVMAQYGINLLAENNSVININPHRSTDEAGLDISSFNLSNRLNHTSVELHSTRSCVVVDNQSTFNARDLGSFALNWDVTGSHYSNRFASGIDYATITKIQPYVSAGSLQFYPNPITPVSVTGSYTAGFQGVDSVTGLLTPVVFSPASDNRTLYYLANRSTAYNNYSSVTFGGTCVRAVNGSLVNVHNVNFPCGWWNASSAYYDNTVGITDAGLCFKTFIWNIADNSQLKASYTSVSGLFPRAAGYVGPQGVWTSGSNVVASGLPSTTPDTSSASILDYFGAAAVSANPFGKTSAQNWGPFRIYFSINPAVNTLTDLTSNTYKVVPQIYAQGYQPSSSLVCSGTEASALFPSLLQRNASNQIVASGYYYGNTMTSPAGYTRVLLDESAAETFANAKHASVGKSGNAKLVSIYYPYNSVVLGSSYTDTGVKSPNTFDLQRDN
jgi:hypothetical protein